jgi:hypothetical protein
MSRFLSVLCLLVGLFMVTGCGEGGGAATVKVKGVVMAGGKAVDDAVITFYSKSGGEAASGRTDAEGKFQLTTRKPNDGAVPGDYIVTVAKAGSEATGMSFDATQGEMSPEYIAAMKNVAKPPKEVKGLPVKGALPAKYASVKDSGLVRTVTSSGPNEFDFDLN